MSVETPISEAAADEMLEKAASELSAALNSAKAEEPTIIDDEPAQEDEQPDAPAAEADDAEDIARARRAGWRPKEEYKGDPKNWKDYADFNSVGDKIASKLTSKIESLASQNKKQEDLIRKLVQAQGQVMQQAKEDALAALRAERRKSIEFGNVEEVEALDAKISIAQAQPNVLDEIEEPEVASKSVDDAVQEFVEAEKSWFNASNPAMVQYAISVEAAERGADPDGDSAEIMARVKEAVTRRFPAKFKGAAKPRSPSAPSVESGSTTVRGSSSTLRFSELPAEVQQIAAYFEKEAGISKTEYLKMLKEGMK
jgi:hypothetical protein